MAEKTCSRKTVGKTCSRKTSTVQVERAIEEVLKTRINELLSDGVSDGLGRCLLDVPSRMNQKVFKKFYKLYVALVNLEQYTVLDSPLYMQYVVFNIDERHSFKISGLLFKHLQTEWARQEGDKLRLLWAYFQRFLEEGRVHQFPRSSDLSRLKMMYFAREGREAEKGVAQEDLPSLLPDAPQPLCDMEFTDSEREDAEQASQMVPIAPQPTTTTSLLSDVIAIDDDSDMADENGKSVFPGVDQVLADNKGKHFDLGSFKAKFGKKKGKGKKGKKTGKKTGIKKGAKLLKASKLKIAKVSKVKKDDKGVEPAKRLRLRGKAAHGAVPSVPSAAAAAAIEDITIDLDNKKRWGLHEYPHIASQGFQEMLCDAVAMAGNSPG